jgi:hypothetical protein
MVINMYKCFAIMFAFALSACAIDVAPMVTGGSKADAVVNVSYIVPEFRVPNINFEEAKAKATKRCQAWGYKNAEAFEGITQSCAQRDIFDGCGALKHTLTYQCIN